jgi:acetylornithine deacetylase/succinyl-diaminopimelate desuccinylase-like protein
MVLLLLKRAGIPLERDVIFLATADEEAGGREGAGWFARNQAELIRDAEFLINEGSSNLMVGDRAIFYGIGTTEKTPCWIRLTAKGTPGHGSVPRRNSAPSRLVRALGKLESYEPEPKATQAVARYFRSVADLQPTPEMMRAYADISAALKDRRLRELLLSIPQNAALLRNTIQPTVVNIGNKTNVIAPVATAEIDCRLLPGERPEDFVAEIKRVIDDPSIEVETILAFAATESPLETDLHKAITSVIRADDPHARFSTTVLTGFTDSHFFRDLGITCYGFSPFMIPGEDYVGVHGNDERIPVDGFRNGTRLLYRIVRQLCQGQPGEGN